jgi:hypothetical protein
MSGGDVFGVVFLALFTHGVFFAWGYRVGKHDGIVGIACDLPDELDELEVSRLKIKQAEARSVKQ